jgi:SAM-dependent methyltransferase
VAEEDRVRWDDRHAAASHASDGATGPPAVFAPHEHVFPASGRALEIACGRGRTAVWLAGRGLDCWGLDISAVAVGLAREMAESSGVGDRCRFDVVDLDDGLPHGPPADVIVCHFFRDRRLDQPILGRLAPGGLLAIAVCSEVDVGSGPFRAAPGELREAFGTLDVLAEGEQQGEAWLLARAPGAAGSPGVSAGPVPLCRSPLGPAPG